MVEGDNEREAAKAAQTFGGGSAKHFYDPDRQTGPAYVRDHFEQELRDAAQSLPKNHPQRARFEEWMAVPRDRVLWDALLVFPPGVEWTSRTPKAIWWTRQIGFTGPGTNRSQFLRNAIKLRMAPLLRIGSAKPVTR